MQERDTAAKGLIRHVKIKLLTCSYLVTFAVHFSEEDVREWLQLEKNKCISRQGTCKIQAQ